MGEPWETILVDSSKSLHLGVYPVSSLSNLCYSGGAKHIENEILVDKLTIYWPN